MTGGTVGSPQSGVAKVKVSCKRRKDGVQGPPDAEGQGPPAPEELHASEGQEVHGPSRLKFSKTEVRKIRKARRKQMQGPCDHDR